MYFLTRQIGKFQTSRDGPDFPLLIRVIPVKDDTFANMIQECQLLDFKISKSGLKILLQAGLETFAGLI